MKQHKKFVPYISIRLGKNVKPLDLMLDSGSEVNIIRLGFVPPEYRINDKIVYNLQGIGSNFIKSLGIIKINVATYISEFVVVPHDFPIIHAGILGTEFFLQSKAEMNFSEKYLRINNDKIKMHQGKNVEHKGNSISSVNINDNNKILPTIRVENPSTSTMETFLVDSGSEVNLIMNYLLPSGNVINKYERGSLKGIGNESLITEGTTEISILGVPILFHVLLGKYTMPEVGILGANYLTTTKAIMDFGNKILTVGEMNKPLDFGITAETEFNLLNPVLSYDSNDINEYITKIPEEFTENSSTGLKYSYKIALTDTFLDLGLNKEEDVTLSSFVGFENLESGNAEIKKENITDLLRLDHLNQTEADYIKKLAEEMRDVFFLPGDTLEGTDQVKHRIPTVDDDAINSKQYKYPHALKEEVNKQVKDLLDAGIIKPSESPYNTPVWIVPKKADSQGNPRWRMVLDFRELNNKTIGDSYPLPNITEIFDQVGSAKYYTVLDLASGFHQIKMDPRDAHKTAFSTPYGHYEFARMPFGLKNAPATFQRLMDNLLHGLQGNDLFVYLDDIVIYANSIKEHDRKFKLLADRLRQANLKLQIDKCDFLKRKVSYLGHILSKDGLSPDPKKIEAVKNFPVPKNIKNIRQFLGLAGYYRRFIKDFAKIAKPLTTLLQKEKDFDWDTRAQESFETLKEFLCNAPLLQFPDLNKPYNITTDASGFAIGGVLSQGEIGKDRPIAYVSRALRDAELNYEVYEKEALAVIYSVQMFRSYVYGRNITIITDHQPLVWFKTADLNTRVQKWRFKLSEYDYTVIYKPGKLNSNADALSRNPVENVDVNVVTRAKAKRLNEKENEKPNNALTNLDQTKDESKKLKPKQKTETNENKNVNNEDNQNYYPKRQRSKPEYYESDISDSETEAEVILPQSQPRIIRNDNDEQLILSETSSYESTDEIDPISSKYIESKELIQCRKGNIAYFVNSSGEPSDNGSKKLIEFNKIPIKQKLEVNEVQQTKRKTKNKHYYSLCIRGKNPESLTIIKQNITTTLSILKHLLIKVKQKEISFAKSEEIEKLNWTEIEGIIKGIFQNSGIDVIICTGSLKYISYEKRDEIFYEMHKSPIGGHRGVSKTYNRIKQNFHWENLKEDIQRRIQQCLNCQLKKLTRLKTKQPMIITDTPGTAFDKVAMDIVGPLPITRNSFEYILTIQDQLSKFCTAVPLTNTLSSTIADAFIKRFICIFGAPKIVLTDQGKNFLSNLMSRIAKRFRIKKIRTTAFHPQSNGSLERSHHALGEYLKQYTDRDNEWDVWLDLAMLNYNTCVQESTKHTPYEVVFGRLARLPSNEPLREADMLPTYKGYVQDLVIKLNGIQKLAFDNLVASKYKSKKYYDKSINPKNFKLGDYVFLLSGPKPGKFGDHYTGPHKILEVLNKNNVNRLRISNINKEIKTNKNKTNNKKFDDETN